MNEKQLIKKINTKNNAHGDLTYPIIANFLEQQEKSLYATSLKDKILRRIRLNKKIKTIPQVIENNFEMILDKTANTNLKNLIVLLLEDSEQTKEIVLKNLDKILARLEYDEERYVELGMTRNQAERSLDFHKRWIIREILRYPEGKEAVKQNVDLMLDTISPEHVFEDIQLIKGLSQQTDQKLNKYIEAHKEAFIYSMAVKNTRNRYESL